MRALERVNAMITLLCPPGRLPKLGLRIYHGPIRYTKVLKQKLILLISFQKILKVMQHLKDMLTLLGRGEVRCCIRGKVCKFPLREKRKQIWKHKDSAAVFLN